MRKSRFSKLNIVNKAMEEIVEDMNRAKNRGDKFESEICYWQLHGMIYALDLLGYYNPRQHRPFEKECEKYLDWLYDQLRKGVEQDEYLLAEKQAQG